VAPLPSFGRCFKPFRSGGSFFWLSSNPSIPFFCTIIFSNILFTPTFAHSRVESYDTRHISFTLKDIFIQNKTKKKHGHATLQTNVLVDEGFDHGVAIGKEHLRTRLLQEKRKCLLTRNPSVSATV
jgi:hypothetical protein